MLPPVPWSYGRSHATCMCRKKNVFSNRTLHGCCRLLTAAAAVAVTATWRGPSPMASTTSSGRPHHTHTHCQSSHSPTTYPHRSLSPTPQPPYRLQCRKPAARRTRPPCKTLSPRHQSGRCSQRRAQGTPQSSQPPPTSNPQSQAPFRCTVPPLRSYALPATLPAPTLAGADELPACPRRATTHASMHPHPNGRPQAAQARHGRADEPSQRPLRISP